MTWWKTPQQDMCNLGIYNFLITIYSLAFFFSLYGATLEAQLLIQINVQVHTSCCIATPFVWNF